MKKFSLKTHHLILVVILSLLPMQDLYTQQASKSISSILSVRDQARIVFQITRQRLDELLPEIMEQTGFDMWIIACNEDNLDPVFETMVPFKMWCPITQVLVISRGESGKEVERLNISRTDLNGLFTNVWDYRAWDRKQGESQWDCLKRIVQERDPERIGINTGEIQWAAGGLTVPLYKRITRALGDKYSRRLSSAEPMVNLWSMILVEEEVELMERAQAISHSIIAEVYSSQVITPGVTTLEDLQFHYWQRVTDLGLEVGAHPKFRIKGRTDEDTEKYGIDDTVIRPGDFIFCDVVLKYMRYYTDHAEWAYVLKAGENDVPEEYQHLMAEGNRLQDIFCSEFKEGLTGNELLSNILKKAKAMGIPSPLVYSHSIGYFLHEPGPLIGLPWEQSDIPGRGDVRLHNGSCFAMELSVAAPVRKEQTSAFVLPLEQVVYFSEKGISILDGRQTSFHLVK